MKIYSSEYINTDTGTEPHTNTPKRINIKLFKLNNKYNGERSKLFEKQQSTQTETKSTNTTDKETTRRKYFTKFISAKERINFLLFGKTKLYRLLLHHPHRRTPNTAVFHRTSASTQHNTIFWYKCLNNLSVVYPIYLHRLRSHVRVIVSISIVSVTLPLYTPPLYVYQ